MSQGWSYHPHGWYDSWHSGGWSDGWSSGCWSDGWSSGGWSSGGWSDSCSSGGVDNAGSGTNVVVSPEAQLQLIQATHAITIEAVTKELSKYLEGLLERSPGHFSWT